MSGVSANDLLPGKPLTSVATDIKDRLSQEMVIALVGPVGSGVSTAAAYVRDTLMQVFAYEVPPIIKMSDFIKAEAHRVGMQIPANLALSEYVDRMQTAGNTLREKYSGNYLAEKVVERIFKFRKENGGYSGDIAVPGRRAYIIDSLKNPEELDLLRYIYGDTLCVFGVFAPDSIRRQRLLDSGVPKDDVDKTINRDQNELASFGQKTRKVFVQADFFVSNDERKDELNIKIRRFLELIFDTAVHTPSKAEAAMYQASSSAANSACMSRQVGAAIVSSDGEMIAVGWNDVPKFGGGLYNEEDQKTLDTDGRKIYDRDNRCFKWGGCICHNEVRRNKIAEKIADKISASGLLQTGKTGNDVLSLLRGSDIDSLIEFSRSIHAEMEAILSVAREGKHSLVGATLYTNTYPCHNCARHIVASGIKSVVYIEPYLKSLATTLHSDAITEDPEDRSRVVFRQYDGVAPRTFLRLFRPHAERKRAGKLVRDEPGVAVPVFRIPLDAQTEYEAKVIADLSIKEHTESTLRGREEAV